jgi:periplasmic protein TonB
MNSNSTKSSLILTLSLLSFHSFGQVLVPQAVEPHVKTEPSEKIYEFVDEPADFPGGRQALMKYLSDNIIYPESAQKNGIQGKCYFQFVVTDSGKVENVKLKKGVPDCPECDKEALRVIKKMPLWTPGKINGKNVNSLFSIPVTFKL